MTRQLQLTGNIAASATTWRAAGVQQGEAADCRMAASATTWRAAGVQQGEAANCHMAASATAWRDAGVQQAYPLHSGGRPPCCIPHGPQ